MCFAHTSPTFLIRSVPLRSRPRSRSAPLRLRNMVYRYSRLRIYQILKNMSSKKETKKIIFEGIHTHNKLKHFTGVKTDIELARYFNHDRRAIYQFKRFGYPLKLIIDFCKKNDICTDLFFNYEHFLKHCSLIHKFNNLTKLIADEPQTPQKPRQHRKRPQRPQP